MKSPFAALRGAWIVGERRGLTAGDNGFDFFRYCRDERKTDHVYFVTTTEVRDLLADTSFVVTFGSFRHLALCLFGAAAVFTCDMRDCLSSQLALALSPVWRTRARYNLGHGSTGLKDDGDYFAFLARFAPLAPTLWTEGSERSREVMLGCLADAEVVVTGLPRYDHLVRNARPLQRENWVICLTFRARLWHSTTADFTNSGVFADLISLLTDPEVAAEIDRRQATITVLVHHEYLPHTAVIAECVSADVEVVGMNEGVADVLLRSSLLITDRSSIAFDMLAIGRPVHFYWSEVSSSAQEHSAARGFTEQDVAAMGSIARTPAELARCIGARSPVVHQADSRFVAFRDDRNSERCFDALTAHLHDLSK